MPGLIDSTLREGVQTVGVDLGEDQRLELAAGLVRLGIEELEMGPVDPADDGLARLVARCRSEAGVKRLAIWCRCLPDDIERSLALAPEVLALSIPVSSLQMRSKLGRSEEEVKAMVGGALAQARGRVECLALGLEDATRAAPEFLREIVILALEHGVDRLRLADTVGVASPAEMAELVRRVRGYCGGRKITIGVHTHNDFGLASANAVAALDAGAQWADVSLLGLGERAGLARLEEVAAYLALRRGHPYRLQKLPRLSATLARFCGRTISPQRPVVGPEIFSCESGLHLAAMTVDPVSYEPFAPETLGRVRKLLYGVKVGRRAIAQQLRRCREPEISPRKVKNLVVMVRNSARAMGRPLTAEELRRVFLAYV